MVVRCGRYGEWYDSGMEMAWRYGGGVVAGIAVGMARDGNRYCDALITSKPFQSRTSGVLSCGNTAARGQLYRPVKLWPHPDSPCYSDFREGQFAVNSGTDSSALLSPLQQYHGGTRRGPI